MNNSSSKYITGVYPGSFDPVTGGHLHMIRRASHIVDKLIVGVADNADKTPLFSLDERVEMLQNDIDSISDKTHGCEIEVTTFNTLLVHFAEEVKASYIIRGLRAVSDFEYEFQMTGMNAKLDPDIETLFLMASGKWQFVSSSFVKEFSSLNGDISSFVTPQVEERLNKKFKN